MNMGSLDSKEYDFPPIVGEHQAKADGAGMARMSMRYTAIVKKSLDSSIATRYRHVSLFNWYAPTKMAKSKEFVPYALPPTKNSFSDTSFLRDSARGVKSYNAQSLTLKSCDVYAPFRVNLLALKNLMLEKVLRKFVGRSEKEIKNNPLTPQSIPIVTYLIKDEPYEQEEL
jgi:hypothetical protein